MRDPEMPSFCPLLCHQIQVFRQNEEGTEGVPLAQWLSEDTLQVPEVKVTFCLHFRFL